MALMFHRTNRSTKLGTYGEHLVAHWLERAGFEAAIADCVGIDIVAVGTKGERLGIGVKTRFYTRLREGGIAKIEDIPKIRKTCAVWSVEPWLALYAESCDEAVLVAMPLDHYLKKYLHKSGNWCMLKIDPAAVSKMSVDAHCRFVTFRMSGNWF